MICVLVFICIKNKLLKLIETKWKYINKHMEKYYKNNTCDASFIFAEFEKLRMKSSISVDIKGNISSAQ